MLNILGCIICLKTLSNQVWFSLARLMGPQC